MSFDGHQEAADAPDGGGVNADRDVCRRDAVQWLTAYRDDLHVGDAVQRFAGAAAYLSSHGPAPSDAGAGRRPVDAALCRSWSRGAWRRLNFAFINPSSQQTEGS